MIEQRVQDFAPWWVACDRHPLQRGQLVRAFVPHVDLTPHTLIPEGREDPKDHSRARFTISPLRVGDRRSSSILPVAALSLHDGEVWTVHRSKCRFALIVSTGGPEVPKELRPSSSPKWQSAATLLAAPYYGTTTSDKRAGWHPRFLDRIRRCEFPQFMIDLLPGEKMHSVLRLDHVQPIGRHHESYEPLPHRLGDDARILLDEWLDWLRTGDLPEDTILTDVRIHLMAEAGETAATSASE